MEKDNFNHADGPTSYYTKYECSTSSYPMQILQTNIKATQHDLYETLKVHCDLLFFSNEFTPALNYTSLYKLYAFATTSSGDRQYVTIGGMGDTSDDDYPVGVMLQDKCLILAKHVRSFLVTLTYYPFWTELIGYSYSEVINIIKSHHKCIDFNRHQKHLLQLLDLNIGGDDVLADLLGYLNSPQYIPITKKSL